MPVTEPTVLQDYFLVTDCIWSYRLDDAGHFTLTSDFLEVDAVADARRGFPTAYSLQNGRSPSSNVWRRALGEVTNRFRAGSQQLLRLESVPLYGQGPITVPTFGNRGAAGDNAMSFSGVMGHAWNMPLLFGADPFDEVPVVLSFNGRTDTIYISRQSGGYLCRWNTEIASAGINQQWIRRLDYGQGIGFSDFWFENIFAISGNRLIHNPTTFGCLARGLSPDPNSSEKHNWMPSPCTKSSIESDGVTATIRSTHVPLEWDRAGSTGSQTDHGGSLFKPVIWPDVKHDVEYVVNWMGIQGVTRVTFRSTITFAIPLCDLAHSGGTNALMDHFDTGYWYDPGTRTLTNVGFVAADPRIRQTVTRTQYKREQPPGTVISTAPSLSSDGFIASVVRATGTQFGTNNDFTIACYGYIHFNDVSKPLVQDHGNSSFQLNMQHAAGTPSPDQTTGQDINAFAEGLSRPAGSRACQWFTISGVFSDVIAKIDQLYAMRAGKAVPE